MSDAKSSRRNQTPKPDAGHGECSFDIPVFELTRSLHPCLRTDGITRVHVLPMPTALEILALEASMILDSGHWITDHWCHPRWLFRRLKIPNKQTPTVRHGAFQGIMPVQKAHASLLDTLNSHSINLRQSTF